MSSVVSSGETGQSQESKDNFNFVQLSRSYLKQLRNLARKSPIAHEILYYLVEHMGKTTNAVICSYATLWDITGVS
ncbi:plasmid replication initiation protein, partial [Escherichia coli]|nr:plasmid replication initiation protein [Escherichia coli]